MYKKLLKNLLVISLTVSALNADKVTISNDGLGDFLIAPVYIAQGNVCSEVNVMNTNETSSILAKVVIRERLASQEVDFPIFLSPGDIWSGTLCQRGNTVVLTSTDDSNHPAVMGELARGKDVVLHSRRAGYNGDFSQGYIEVYPIAQYYEGCSDKVEKSVLVKRWDELVDGCMLDPKLVRSGVDEYSLSGSMTFKVLGSRTTTLPMKAFKGTHSIQVIGDAISYGSVANADLLLGEGTVVELLKLMQTSKISFAYDNNGANQYINLTFPFGYGESQQRSFKITIRDMSENKDIEAIFSPRPMDPKVKNEMATVSIQKLIANHTRNAFKYSKGMIQIKEIRNNTQVQFGTGYLAAVIPTKLTWGRTVQGAKSRKIIHSVENITYISTTPAH
ncbi:MAG: hypothetical protein GQ570_09490 [Helicobacteraceae bacterium]|nr:hypothetical protein [Helicobacteraceae bacterium]